MRDMRTPALAGLGLVCAFLLGLQFGSGGEQAWAQQAAGAYGGATVSQNARFVAATGSVGSGMSVLWLIDTEAKRLVVYGTGNLGKSVELRAARNIEWDLRLDEYNDESQYSAEDLERLARRRQRVAGRKAGKPESEKGDGGSEGDKKK